MNSVSLFSFQPLRAALALSLCLSAFSAGASGSKASPPALLAAPAAMGAATAGGPSQSPGAGDSTTLVQFDAAAALALPIGGEAAITLPRLGTLTVVHDREERHPNGDVTWVGYFKGWGDNSASSLQPGLMARWGVLSARTASFPCCPAAAAARGCATTAKRD